MILQILVFLDKTRHGYINSVICLQKLLLKILNNDTQMTYAIVSESEADLSAKKISVSSPIGKGVLGKKIGEIAEIKLQMVL